ncbi:MAG: hypothetical protein IPP72_13780 [Chitinophagaceae bacterium]|nr:hypothetical protein [Chitinophagaceae bacterium]
MQTTLLRDTPPKPLISSSLVLQYPEDIANLSLLNNVAIITFKDGRVERYDLKKASEKSVFMKSISICILQKISKNLNYLRIAYFFRLTALMSYTIISSEIFSHPLKYSKKNSSLNLKLPN